MFVLPIEFHRLRGKERVIESFVSWDVPFLWFEIASSLPRLISNVLDFREDIASYNNLGQRLRPRMLFVPTCTCWGSLRPCVGSNLSVGLELQT